MGGAHRRAVACLEHVAHRPVSWDWVCTGHDGAEGKASILASAKDSPQLHALRRPVWVLQIVKAFRICMPDVDQRPSDSLSRYSFNLCHDRKWTTRQPLCDI